MIPETVTLAFDPKTASKEVQAVFSDDLARTIWLAVKRSHLTSNSFNDDCLQYAQNIRRVMGKGRLTAVSLLNSLSGIAAPPGHGIIGTGELDFAADLLPFVNGEKTIGFKVEIKQQNEEEAFQERISSLGPGRQK